MKQKMSRNLEKQAEELAGQPYSIEFSHDETTTGEPIIVVSHPELPGCMAQGSTFNEALTELEDARKEYILSLLEDGLAVPKPLDRTAGTNIITVGTQGTSWQLVEGVISNETVNDTEIDSHPVKSAIVSIVRLT
jgi:predicted RNase H-like HicB family nuclease